MVTLVTAVLCRLGLQKNLVKMLVTYHYTLLHLFSIEFHCYSCFSGLYSVFKFTPFDTEHIKSKFSFNFCVM